MCNATPAVNDRLRALGYEQEELRLPNRISGHNSHSVYSQAACTTLLAVCTCHALSAMQTTLCDYACVIPCMPPSEGNAPWFPLISSCYVVVTN